MFFPPVFRHISHPALWLAVSVRSAEYWLAYLFKCELLANPSDEGGVSRMCVGKKYDATLYLSYACASHGARCRAAKRGDVLNYYLTFRFRYTPLFFFKFLNSFHLRPGAAMTVEQNVLQQHSQKVKALARWMFLLMRQAGKVSISLAS